MTTPQSGQPDDRRAAAPPSGRHRSELPTQQPNAGPAPHGFAAPPTSPGPYGPPDQPGPGTSTGRRQYVPSARAARPPEPPQDPAAGRYRSLKDMSAQQPPADPAQRTAPRQNAIPDALQHLTTPAETPRRGWTPRRWATLGILAGVVVLVLVVGGYFGYRALAPYYGLGYVSGRSTTVEGVRLTTTQVKCGLSTPPFEERGTPHGAYCAIVVSADNVGNQTAVINLRTWTADLDVGLEHVEPVTEWLAFRNEIVETGQRASFQLAYDIPTGARLERLHLVVGEHSGTIATT